MIQLALFILCPTFIFSWVLAEPLYYLIFSETWAPAIPYFRVLCIIGIFYPLNAYNLTILNVKGRSDLFLKLEIFKRIIIVLGICFTLPFGLWSLLYFEACSAILMYVINGYYTGRFIDYNMLNQLKDIYPIFLLSSVSGLVLTLMSAAFFQWTNIFQIIIGSILGVSIYIFGAYIFRLEPFEDLKNIIKEYKRNRRVT